MHKASQSRNLNQGSRFKVQGSRFKVQGSRFKVQGSRFKVQGSRKESKRMVQRRQVPDHFYGHISRSQQRPPRVSTGSTHPSVLSPQSSALVPHLLSLTSHLSSLPPCPLPLAPQPQLQTATTTCLLPWLSTNTLDLSGYLVVRFSSNSTSWGTLRFNRRITRLGLPRLGERRRCMVFSLIFF
ncbi:MAG: hypothetical protein C0613_07645 [Desulfobulbaceae bacterium]|nr:MAG: hypothetical protein C0613_07645 [Desulfobulbaceae bacterium]